MMRFMDHYRHSFNTKTSHGIQTELSNTLPGNEKKVAFYIFFLASWDDWESSSDSLKIP